MSDINTIDYSPLDADRHVFKTVYQQHVALNTSIFAGAVALCLFAWVVSDAFILSWIAFAAVVLRVMVLGAQVKALKNSVWEQFALANGWSFDAEYTVATITPQSLQFGRDQSLSPVIAAQLGSLNADLFAYTTVTGGGKSQQTWNFSVARVRLPVALPHIMLRAKKGLGQEVRQDFADHETLQLEGDFQDYFSLQIEKGQEVNVLEILTPDVMQTLVSFSQQEDIEIDGDQLFFIVSGDARTPEPVRQLVQSVAGVSMQILEQVAHTTAPDVPAVQPVSIPEPTPVS